LNKALTVLPEPLLEFGNGGKEVDIRLGLMRHGPLEPDRASKVRLGLIGTGETNDAFQNWVERCRTGMEAKSSRQPNLFMPFPGLGNENPFRCAFEIDPMAVKSVPRSDLGRITNTASRKEAIEAAVEMYATLAQDIAEAPAPPQVIVCTLPIQLIERVVNDHLSDDVDDDDEDHDETLNFRDLLKARTIHLKLPLQLIWPTTWDDTAKIARKLSKLSGRKVQDSATRAWNLFNGLYYKAGYVPWRLPRDPSALATSYVGISFYKDPLNKSLETSTAQMFDERGQGLILRGGRARTGKSGRHPYLARVDAYELMRRALMAYQSHHQHAPARMIVYKTSQFREEEVDGFEEALNEKGVPHSDFVWVYENTPFRLLRDGGYPPFRGTLLELDRGSILYTRGSVPYFRTYPGLYIPRPLELRPYARDSSIDEISAETLALTKMNWNTTQFDGSLPITLRAAREVSKVLRYVSSGTAEAVSYRQYI
jgi:hypothetical protein